MEEEKTHTVVQLVEDQEVHQDHHHRVHLKVLHQLIQDIMEDQSLDPQVTQHRGHMELLAHTREVLHKVSLLPNQGLTEEVEAPVRPTVVPHQDLTLEEREEAILVANRLLLPHQDLVMDSVEEKLEPLVPVSQHLPVLAVTYLFSLMNDRLFNGSSTMHMLYYCDLVSY